MPRSSLYLALGALALGACSSDGGTSTPVAATLQNDAYPTVGVAFQGGFMTGDGAAAIFAPRNKAYTVEHIQFLFGGGGSAQTVTLALYADSGAAAPGAPLYSADFSVTPANDAMQDLDLTTEAITVAAHKGLRVALIFQHTGLPGVAADSGGIGMHRNALYTGGNWFYGETVGLTGDLVLRALILTP